ncbi:formimidoylglutamate deiminase [Bordetella genomosp. 11]|uniref:Formimidoylglutamate deiminase n=1 Tax=Bordetella genomosp. 11 TaxID=1416808 RepID=A0A261UF48_9BORD|nr:formimidoylglutamate deiminase [Bordetella genomosp. 11]OZI60215.1 formimidoylglutamate deiminase [Bordetella genomosp. 11]
MNGTHSLWAADALLPGGWARDVALSWDAHGRLTAVRPGTAPAPDQPRATGPLIPGMPNLHSHAFQRGFCGLTEYRAQAADSFWSWRELMYRCAGRIDPAHAEAIATWLYVEMLEAGYTGVCEFHYLHHDPRGQPYAQGPEMAQAILRAAARAGIGMTLLPVLYQTGGFGGAAAHAGQRRFLHDTAAMLRLLDTLKPACDAQGARLGLAPHSLRAVPPASLAEALAGLDALDPGAPIHIHIAEQVKEVEDCIAWSGLPPVRWLLENAPVGPRWCLVHATHMTPEEAVDAARTGAVAGLCPTTEANLGDGLFDMARWREGNGLWGIGSDSHSTVNAAEELQWLEYGLRLTTRQRNVMADAEQPHVATAMTLAAVAGGARASGRATGGLQPGEQADFLELDAQHVALAGLPARDMLSAHVFGSHRTSAIRNVWVGGQARVREGRHALRDEAAAAFVQVRRMLVAES